MVKVLCFPTVFQDNLTSIHYAVQSNQPVMLQALLDRLKLNGTDRDSDVAHQFVAIVDSNGWSVAHMAAALPNQVICCKRMS